MHSEPVRTETRSLRTARFEIMLIEAAPGDPFATGLRGSLAYLLRESESELRGALDALHRRGSLRLDEFGEAIREHVQEGMWELEPPPPGVDPDPAEVPLSLLHGESLWRVGATLPEDGLDAMGSFHGIPRQRWVLDLLSFLCSCSLPAERLSLRVRRVGEESEDD